MERRNSSQGTTRGAAVEVLGACPDSEITVEGRFAPSPPISGGGEETHRRGRLAVRPSRCLVPAQIQKSPWKVASLLPRRSLGVEKRNPAQGADGASTGEHVSVRTSTPLRGAYLWKDSDRQNHVILSERVRERVEGSPDGARVDPTLRGRSRPERSPNPEEILRLATLAQNDRLSLSLGASECRRASRAVPTSS